MQLTSTQNPFLRSVRKAAAAGRPTEDGLLVAEGPHLLEEALRGTWHIEKVLGTAEALERHTNLVEQARAEVVEVPGRALSSIASTESTQEVLALLRPRAWSWKELLRDTALLVVLDAIQDPGNAGTIARSAEAFGATGLVFLNGSTRVSNGKFLRAAAGSIFRLPFLESITSQDFIERLQSAGPRLYALAPRGRTTLIHTDFAGACALLVGAEGAGVSPELLAASESISIPTRHVESLNAAVACSVALFEAFRQRTA
jgi:RNA methyltransferase, TrmH family